MGVDTLTIFMVHMHTCTYDSQLSCLVVLVHKYFEVSAMYVEPLSSDIHEKGHCA